jgi:hypothetical protein
MTTNGQATAGDALKTGRRAAEDLADALRGAGFKLPSLAGDFPVMDRAYVQLGGLAAAEAFRLAAWIREQTRSLRSPRCAQGLSRGGTRARNCRTAPANTERVQTAQPCPAHALLPRRMGRALCCSQLSKTAVTGAWSLHRWS